MLDNIILKREDLENVITSITSGVVDEACREDISTKIDLAITLLTGLRLILNDDKLHKNDKVTTYTVASGQDNRRRWVTFNGGGLRGGMDYRNRIEAIMKSFGYEEVVTLGVGYDDHFDIEIVVG